MPKRRQKGSGGLYRVEQFNDRIVGRFWPKVRVVDEPGACWEWTASLRKGYGQFGVAARDVEYAHRIAYELLVDTIPEGMQLDHLCRVRHCVNPEHLEVVTPGENYRRGFGFSGINHRKTHCPKRHPYDGVNTYVDAKGQRHCRTCRRAREQARRDAR